MEISDRTTFIREEKPFAGYIRPADEEEAKGEKEYAWNNGRHACRRNVFILQP